MIRVLIVDDSLVIRRLFTELLSHEPDIEVIGTAEDPYDARDKIKALNPDVVTLDIEMPKMDGLAFLEKIMTLRPTPVVMASSLTQKGAMETIRALELGAVDTVGKPQGTLSGDRLEALKQELAGKIRIAASANVQRIKPTTPPASLSYTSRGKPPIIAIGASTGGVEALRDVMSGLPATCPPVVITQHMPQSFVPSFAARLDSLSPLTVREAHNGDRLKAGCAYVAPGNVHLKIARLGPEYVCRLEDGPLVSGHRPSVDVMFHSVAQATGAHAVGVILTGMGRDGAEGLLAMRQAGATTLGQDAASCVVYGMPRVAFELGGVAHQHALRDMPARIIAACEAREHAAHG